MITKRALGQGEKKWADMHNIMFCSFCGVYSSQVMRKLFKAPCQGNMSKSKHHLVHLQRGRHPIYNIPVDYKHKLKVRTFTEVKAAVKARRAVAEQPPSNGGSGQAEQTGAPPDPPGPHGMTQHEHGIYEQQSAEVYEDEDHIGLGLDIN